MDPCTLLDLPQPSARQRPGIRESPLEYQGGIRQPATLLGQLGIHHTGLHRNYTRRIEKKMEAMFGVWGLGIYPNNGESTGNENGN